MPQITLSRFILLLGIACAVLLVELGGAKLWDRDEPRNSRASHEMLQRGDWIVPTFNGQLRDHKPILLYWSQMSAFLALGESEFTARLPSALAALLTVLATAWLASRISGVKRGISVEGFWAAGVLVTCLLFVMAGRAATPDALLIAFSTLGIALLVVGTLKPSPPYSVGRVGKTSWSYAVLGYTALGLAALAKGPVGIVLPLAVVHLWWLICDGAPRLRPLPEASPPPSLAKSTLRHASGLWLLFNPLQCWRATCSLRVVPGLIVCLAVAAPWYIQVGLETEGAFLRGFFWEHNVGRAVSSMEGHSGSLFFYPLAFLVGTFPWSLWLFPILFWCCRAARTNAVQQQTLTLSGAWIAVYLVAFSCAGTKLPSYITPCYAGAALAVAGYLRQFESAWSLPPRHWRFAAYSVAILSGVGISLGLAWLSIDAGMPRLIWISTGGLLFVVLGGLAFGLDKLNRTAWVPSCWLAIAVMFHIVVFGIGARTVDSYRTEVQTLAGVNKHSPSENWLAIGGMEPSWVHYLNRTIVEISRPPTDPEAWQQVLEFASVHSDARIIVSGEQAVARFDQLIQTSQAPHALQLIAVAPRFLKPGRLAIYGRFVAENNQGRPPGSRRPPNSTKRLATQTSPPHIH